MLQIRKLMQTRGFTLVELLIVIAVIGILAIAVLAALDPIEQLKKSRDTGRLSDAREFYNAMTRYYASFNCYPDENTFGTAQCVNADYPSGFTPLLWSMGNQAADEFSDTLTALLDAGELKPAYENKQSIQNGQIFFNHASTGTLAVCFHPESKAARSGGIGPLSEQDDLDATDGCVVTATYTSVDPDLAEDVDCLVCVQ